MSHQSIKKEECPHTADMKIIRSGKSKCDVCGDTEYLRVCTSCGGNFCCESHKAHNRKHFEDTGHPIIKPVTDSASSDWTWCWKCNAYLT